MARCRPRHQQQLPRTDQPPDGLAYLHEDEQQNHQHQQHHHQHQQHRHQHQVLLTDQAYLHERQQQAPPLLARTTAAPSSFVIMGAQQEARPSRAVFVSWCGWW